MLFVSGSRLVDQLDDIDEAMSHSKIGGAIDYCPDTDCTTLLEVFLDTRVFVERVESDIGAPGRVTILVANSLLVVFRIWRPKISLTSSGRPMSMLSATVDSKKDRALRCVLKVKV